MTDPGGLLAPPTTARGRLQRACMNVLRRYEERGELPTSARFVYYDLKQSDYPLKTHARRRADTDVIEACMHLRNVGLVPWKWFSDETRSVTLAYAAPTLRRWLADMLDHARLDPWGEVLRPMIICESRGVRAALRATANRYCVPMFSSNGQAGGFLRTDVAPLLESKTPVGYFGDWNPAGQSIEDNTRDVLEDVVGGDLDWTRLAITDQQAETEGLPPKPATDGRYRDGRPHDSYEAEALGATRLVGIATDWLDGLTPEPIAAVLGRETGQRQQLREDLRG